MKKVNGKKGFTVVELVIVIAVIAILTAVLIPTFSGLIGKANGTALQQELTYAWSEYYEANADSGEALGQKEVYISKDSTIAASSVVYKFTEGDNGKYTWTVFKAKDAAVTGTYTNVPAVVAPAEPVKYNGYYVFGYEAPVTP